MYNKKQIKAIVDVLKNTDRDSLKRVFTSGGYIWATNGYVALELGELRDDTEGFQVSLERLVGWYGTHGAKDTTTLMELKEPLDGTVPDMATLLHKEYGKPDEVRIDMQYLNLASRFLGVDRITFEENNSGCYRIKPLEDMHIANEAAGIKAYVMGERK